jgi:hypothetical protein
MGRVHRLFCFVRELSAALTRLAAYLGTLAGLAGLAIYAVPQLIAAPDAADAPPDRRSAWSDVARPYPAFALVMSEFDGTESHYLIRKHSLGGRKDIISFGDPAGPATHLRLEIYRPGGEQERFGRTAAEIAARVTDWNPEGGMTPAGMLGTKFGFLPLVDFMIHPVGGERRCLGFAKAFSEPLVQIAGTYCRRGPEIVDRGLLACALDRLTFTAGGAEPRLAELFAQAEVKRSFCGHRGLILAATPRRDSWLDSTREPRLRGRL